MPTFRKIVLILVTIWVVVLSLAAASAITWVSATNSFGELLQPMMAVVGRQLQITDDEWRDFDDKDDDVDDDWTLIQLALNVLGPIVYGIVSAITAWIYWSLYIKPEPNKYIPQRAIIPDDLKGRFTYELCDCCSAGVGLFCCFLMCPGCAITDLWYRAGHLHALIGGEINNPSAEQCCPGWYFFAGLCGWCLLQDTGCAPCLYGVLRSGFPGSDSDMGGIESHHKRFGMPGGDCNLFCSSCCLWCWCGICAGIQEYRQIMDALNRGPLQVAQPANTIVGVPVAVAVPVVGTPVATANQNPPVAVATVVQTNEGKATE